ncbi:RAMP superfamily CRISPR-associated protein [Thermodesulfovibrio sp. 3907-1M]|uniref:CRISPR system Cms protein Csm4 n=1 Tax=Thermodesulfovibrio autotrophicus TaxID=3118333 RepID=A0AAU8GVN9_9BACT
MKTYIVKIKPLTGFGSPIKGDSLFGHLCWQAVYDPQLFGKPLKELLKDYEENPFIIVSSAFPFIDEKIYLKRPSLPLFKLFKLTEEEFVQKRKELKSKNYFAFEIPLKPLNEIEYEKINFIEEDTQTRCTINRISGTTGEPPFNPYTVDRFYFNCELAIFAGIRQDITIDSFEEALSRVGKYGFGKDATVGYGKFEVIESKEIQLSNASQNFNALYTLAPSVPKKEEVKEIYFSPFIRFGRHGSFLAKSKNPFKNPVIFADEAAVIIPAQYTQKPYIGMSVRNLSKTVPETVTQGYSLVLPVEVR